MILWNLCQTKSLNARCSSWPKNYSLSTTVLSDFSLFNCHQWVTSWRDDRIEKLYQVCLLHRGCLKGDQILKKVSVFQTLNVPAPEGEQADPKEWCSRRDVQRDFWSDKSSLTFGDILPSMPQKLTQLRSRRAASENKEDIWSEVLRNFFFACLKRFCYRENCKKCISSKCCVKYLHAERTGNKSLPIQVVVTYLEWQIQFSECEFAVGQKVCWLCGNFTNLLILKRQIGVLTR